MKQFSVNDAKITIHRIKGIRTVFLYLLIKGGYWYEKETTWGSLHLLEHLTNQATQKLINPRLVEEYKERHGISSNAWVSGDHIGYYFKIPDVKLKEALNFIEGIIFNPLITPKILANEKKVITNEYHSYWENPYNRFCEKWLKQKMGAGHVFVRNGIGKLENIESVDVNSLYQLHSDYYQPQNMFIGIAGNVRETEIIGQIKKMLGKKKNAKKLEFRFEKPQARGKTLKYYDNVDQSLVSLFWSSPGRNKTNLREVLSINIAKHVIGSSRNSILYNKLRFDEGLVYSSGSRITYFPTVSIFELWAKTSKSKVKRVIKIMHDSVNYFLEGNLSEVKERFNQGSKYMDLQTIMFYDSAGNIAERLAYDLFIEGKTFCAEDILEITKTITLKETRKLLRKYLTKEKWQVAIMYPNKPLSRG